MSERELNVSIPQTDLEIQGVLRDASMNAPIVVFVHGFTGHIHEQQFFNGARVLEAAGFSTYRFSLYNEDLKARKFLDATVQTHIEDLDLVVRMFKDNAPRRPVSVVGHSLGGIVTLCSAEKRFDAAVLWDPAHSQSTSEEHAVWTDALGCWVVPGHVDMLVGNAMMKSWAEAPADQAALTFDIPTKVIVAGAGRLQTVGLNYSNAIPAAHEYVVVPEADHCFDAGDSAIELHAQTISWLKKYGS